jgi:hypothetical protein
MKKFHKNLIRLQSNLFDKAYKETIKNIKKFQSKLYSKDQLQTMYVNDIHMYGLTRKQAMHMAYKSKSSGQKAKAVRDLSYSRYQPFNRTTWDFKVLCLKMISGKCN